jgi:hypothetical protein
MRRIICTTLSVFLLFAHSSAQTPVIVHSDRPEHSQYRELVRIEESHRYGVVDPINSPEAWLGISDISPGPDNSVLVTDNRQQRVDLVIPGRGVVRSFGTGVGAGPGELGQPWAAAYGNRNRVFITEYGNARISVFNVDGEFIETIRPEHIPGRVAVGRHQELWVGRTFGNEVDLVDQYSTESGRLLQSVGDRYRNEDWYGHWRHEPFLTIAGDRLIVSTRYPSDLLEYDHTGTMTRILTRDISWLTPPEPDPDQPEQVWNLMNGQARQVAALPNGSILALVVRRQVSDRDSEPSYSFILDLIAPDGHWLTSIPVSGFGENWHVQSMTVAHDGGLWLCYIDDEDIFRVVRYNFEIVR